MRVRTLTHLRLHHRLSPPHPLRVEDPRSAIAKAAPVRYTPSVNIPREWTPPLRWSRRVPIRPAAGPRPGFAGFSLIELLITLALLIILVVLWHGFGSRSNQERQKQACQKNLRTIFMALELYAGEHDDRFPSAPDAKTSEDVLGVLIPKYTVGSESFVCPGSKDRRIPSATALADQRISYVYFMNRRRTDTPAVLMSDRWVDAKPKPKGATVFSTDGQAPGNNHHRYGGNFLLTDGEVHTSGPVAPFTIEWPNDVIRLNPR